MEFVVIIIIVRFLKHRKVMTIGAGGMTLSVVFIGEEECF